MTDLSFHYITQDIPGISHETLALQACRAGARLIQLRIKNQPHAYITDVARAVREICRRHHATLIINDYIHIAKEIDADGVHLGNSDMNHASARKMIGDQKIIGGTAYTISEASTLLSENIVDYIGIGAFKPTATKPEINNFLSLQDIRTIVKNRNAMQAKARLIVLGGVKLHDIPELMQCGIDGIAAASLVTSNPHKEGLIASVYASIEAHRQTNATRQLQG
ncbi:MAG TPA: thiamine phosphate synthase [Chryseolinea sp.]